jgi:hypothetical protein
MNVAKSQNTLDQIRMIGWLLGGDGEALSLHVPSGSISGTAGGAYAVGVASAAASTGAVSTPSGTWSAATIRQTVP